MNHLQKRGMYTDAVVSTDTSLNMARVLSSGLVPEKYLGMDYGGNGLQKIAHRQQQLKQIDNLVHDGVSDQLTLTIEDNNGLVTTPFKLFGETMRPDKHGKVRITDEGKLDQLHEIEVFQIREVDKLMKYAQIGDEACSYLFGVPLKTWLGYCRPKGCPTGCYMSDELKALDCTKQHIRGMLPSLTQAQCIYKLRTLVEFFAPNVNKIHLSTIGDKMKNMKDGHNIIVDPPGIIFFGFALTPSDH
jgi:hypothetical protein